MKDKTGFTLVEIMIAMTILVVGLIGVLALFPVGMSAAKRAGDISQASILAQLQLEQIKEARDSYLSPDVYPSLGSTSPPPQPEQIFSEHPNFSWRAIVSMASISNLYKVDLAIYWKDPHGELGITTKYSSENFITYITDYD